MKFHLPQGKQKHLWRNCRPVWLAEGSKEGAYGQPSPLLEEAEQADGDRERWDHWWGSKSCKETGDLQNCIGLGFSPLWNKCPGAVWGLDYRRWAHKQRVSSPPPPPWPGVSPRNGTSGRAAVVTETAEVTAVRPKADAGVGLGVQGAGRPRWGIEGFPGQRQTGLTPESFHQAPRRPGSSLLNRHWDTYTYSSMLFQSQWHPSGPNILPRHSQAHGRIVSFSRSLAW